MTWVEGVRLGYVQSKEAGDLLGLSALAILPLAEPGLFIDPLNERYWLDAHPDA